MDASPEPVGPDVSDGTQNQGWATAEQNTDSKMSLSTGEIEESEQSLEEFPIDDIAQNLSHSALRKALFELTEEESETDSGTRTHTTSTIPQFPIEDSRISISNSDSRGFGLDDDRKLSILSQHPINESEQSSQSSPRVEGESLSQYPIVDSPAGENLPSLDSGRNYESKSAHSAKEDGRDPGRGESPEYGMCATRPGTVIERPGTCEDLPDKNTVQSREFTAGSEHPEHSQTVPKVVAYSQPHQALEQNHFPITSEKSYEGFGEHLPIFVDPSLKLGSDSHRVSIDDSVVHAGRHPLSSSTPYIVRENSTTGSDKVGSDSGHPSSVTDCEQSILDSVPGRTITSTQNETDYMTLEERENLLHKVVKLNLSHSSETGVDSVKSGDSLGLRRRLEGASSEEIKISDYSSTDFLRRSSHSSVDSAASLQGSRRDSSGSNQGSTNSHRSSGSHRSGKGEISAMLGKQSASLTSTRSSIERLSNGSGDVQMVPSLNLVDAKRSSVESANGGMLVKPSAGSLNSSGQSSSRVSVGSTKSAERYNNGNPITDVHADHVSTSSRHSLSDRLSTGSLPSLNGKVSIGRSSGASSLASEPQERKSTAGSAGSRNSAKLLLDEMYIASKRGSNGSSSISTGSLSEFSLRSSRVPSERLSNASSLSALSEHIDGAPDSARNEDTAASALNQLARESDRHLATPDDDNHSFSAKVAALLAEVPPEGAGGQNEDPRRISGGPSENASFHSLRRSSTESEQDMEKINIQYSALLKGDLASTGPLGSTGSIGQEVLEEKETDLSTGPLPPNGEEEDVDMAPRSALKQDVEITTVMMNNGAVIHRPSSRGMNNSMSSTESEDALDRDVRRILAKYGRSLSDSEDESESKKGNVSPAVSLDSIGERVHGLLKEAGQNDLKPAGTLSIPGTQNLPQYLFDDPSKSMSLPFDATSNVSEETPMGTQTSLKPDLQFVKRSQDGGGNEPASALKTNQAAPDSLGQKVLHLLNVTDHLGEGTLPHVGSDTQSMTSSIDYKMLAQDLDEIQSNLESMKSDSEAEINSRRSSQVSQRSDHIVGSAFTAEYSTPNKHDWDHGADAARGRKDNFVASDLSRVKATRSDLGPNPLLTSGVVPMDLALDIMHGSGTTPQRRSYDALIAKNGEFTSKGFELEPGDEDDESDREVAALNGVDLSDNAPQAGSATQQISDIMERDALPHQPYQYSREPEEEESNINIGVGPRLSEFDRQQLISPANVTSGSYSFKMSPVKPHEPFNAFGRIGSMFSSQVNKVSTQEFDQSVELRSPLKRQMDLHRRVSPTSYETEDIDEQRETILAQRTTKSYEDISHYDSNPVRSPNHGHSYEQDLLSTSQYHNRSYDHSPPDNHFEALAKLSRSQETLTTSQHRELDHQVRGAQTYEPYSHHPRERYSYPPSGHRDSQLWTGEGSPRVSVSSPVVIDDYLRRSPDVTKDGLQRDADWLQSIESRSERISGRFATRSPPPSAPQPGSSIEERGQVNDLETRRYAARAETSEAQPRHRIEADKRPSLRPYRPAGSNEVYYVEIGEDCAQSVALSETTVESTHAGSDDAHAPSFPAGVLGTRGDPSPNGPGLYAKGKTTVARETELVTIQEASHLSSDDKERESDKIPSSSSNRSTKSTAKDLSFSRTKDWVNGNFSGKEEEAKPAYSSDITVPRSSYENYTRDGPASRRPLNSYQRDTGVSVTHTESSQARPGDGFSSRIARDSYTKMVESLDTQPREISSARRSPTDRLSGVLSPVRSKPAQLMSPLDFSTPQKHGTSGNRSGKSGDISAHKEVSAISSIAREPVQSPNVVGTEPVERKQRSIDEICAEYYAKYKEYDYTDILTDMKSVETTEKDDSRHLSSERDSFDTQGAVDRHYSLLQGKQQSMEPSVSNYESRPMSEKGSSVYTKPVSADGGLVKYDSVRTTQMADMRSEREEGYHPYIPDTKFHGSQPGSSLLRERQKAELDNSLLRDIELLKPGQYEQEERVKNIQFLHQRSPQGLSNRPIAEGQVGENRQATRQVDYKNTYSPDKYGTYKSYKDLVEREYDTLTKEYENRAVETRDIERAQALGVIQPSKMYEKYGLYSHDREQYGTGYEERPLHKELERVNQHLDQMLLSRGHDTRGPVESNDASHQKTDIFIPLEPDQDVDNVAGYPSVRHPDYVYTSHPPADHSRTPPGRTLSPTSYLGDGSPVTYPSGAAWSHHSRPISPHFQDRTSSSILPGSTLYSRSQLTDTKSDFSKSDQPSRSQHSSRSPHRSPSPSRTSDYLVMEQTRSPPRGILKNHSPSRSLRESSPGGNISAGLDDTDILLKTTPTMLGSHSRDRSPAQSREFDLPRNTNTEQEDRRHQRMLELMSCQSPGISNLPSNVNEMWDRMRDSRNNTRSDGNTTGSSLDLSRLSSMLRNPAQHFVKGGNVPVSNHDSSMSEEEERKKLKDISQRLKRFAEPKPPSGRLNGAKQNVNRRSHSLEKKAQNQYTEEPGDLRYGSAKEKGNGTNQGSGSNQTSNGRQNGEKGSQGGNGKSETTESGSGHTGSFGSSQAAQSNLGGNGGKKGSDSEDEKKPPPNKQVSLTEAQEEEEMETEVKEDGVEEDPLGYEGEEKEAERSKGGKPKKMAWVITDETLQSVPEDSTLDSVSSDFTASSSVESDGKVVTRTSKRHLPADPKLLKLQQKIAKQKAKYEREHYRELKRKEKIQKLETMLTGKGRTQRKPSKGDAVTYGAKSGRVTSTPSSARVVSSTSESTTLTVSDITTSTLTGSSLMTSDESTTMRESSPERSMKYMSSRNEESTRCDCKQYAPTRSEFYTPTKHKPSKSPSRKKRVNDIPIPKSIKLQEVDWSREDRVRQQTPNGYFMEFEPPKLAKKNRKHGQSPARKGKENEMLSKKRSKEDSNRAAKKGEKHRKHSPSPDHKTREFEATCPTPISVTPPQKRQLGDVIMVSEAVQTVPMDQAQVTYTEEGRGANRRRGFVSFPEQYKANTSHPGMFTPEGGNTPRDMGKGEKLTVKAGPCGMAWYIPITESKPWRKPLSERQAHAESMETDLERASKMDAMTYGRDGLLEQHDQLDPEIYLGKTSMGQVDTGSSQEQQVSLQEAFERRKQDFISRSRERERYVLLRAEERRIQDLHQSEREKLFLYNRKQEPGLPLCPISERHYNPQKRVISRKQMLETTKKMYQRLPEVKQHVEDKRKVEFYKTNRLKAQLYKQRILNKVLNKQGPWLAP